MAPNLPSDPSALQRGRFRPLALEGNTHSRRIAGKLVRPDCSERRSGGLPSELDRELIITALCLKTAASAPAQWDRCWRIGNCIFLRWRPLCASISVACQHPLGDIAFRGTRFCTGYWQREKREALALITKYQTLDLPPLQRLPHSADIALNPTDLSVHVVGPADEDDLPLYEAMRTLRDYLFSRSELNMRNSKMLALAAENKEAYAFCVLATILNAKMPPSHVQTTSARVNSAWRYRSLPMKQLRQEKERLYDLLEDQLGELRPVRRIGNVDHALT